MFEIHLPALKKIQTISAVAACVGFIIGVLIPARAIFANNWPCPFGEGPIQVWGFLGIIGIGSGIVTGNLVAIVLIGIAKHRQTTTNSSKKESNS